jgi:hypothetical protein
MRFAQQLLPLGAVLMAVAAIMLAFWAVATVVVPMIENRLVLAGHAKARLPRPDWRWLAHGLRALARALGAHWRTFAGLPWPAWRTGVLFAMASLGMAALVVLLWQERNAALRIAGHLALLGLVLLATAALLFVLWAAVTRVGGLLKDGLAFTAHARQRALDVLLAFAVAGAAALLALLITPDAGIAVAATCAVIAGVAGFAVISLGPTLFSIVTVHFGGRRRDGGKLAQRGAWMLGVAAFLAAALLVTIEITSDPAAPRQERQQAQPDRPAGNAPDAAQAPGGELTLRIDGVSGEAAWRLGYRDAAVRLGDAGAIGAMTLGPEACAAPAIVAVGAASSDGDPAANRRLALRRARWLADWAAAELASCPTPPAVLAASVGQSRETPPVARQRQVRLFALEASEAASEAEVRRSVGARLGEAPEGLEICALSGEAAPPCF